MLHVTLPNTLPLEDVMHRAHVILVGYSLQCLGNYNYLNDHLIFFFLKKVSLKFSAHPERMVEVWKVLYIVRG